MLYVALPRYKSIHNGADLWNYDIYKRLHVIKCSYAKTNNLTTYVMIKITVPVDGCSVNVSRTRLTHLKYFIRFFSSFVSLSLDLAASSHASRRAHQLLSKAYRAWKSVGILSKSVRSCGPPEAPDTSRTLKDKAILIKKMILFSVLLFSFLFYFSKD